MLTLQQEYRLPAERKRRVNRGYLIEDRLLSEVTGRIQLKTADDLVAMLPDALKQPKRTEPFTTGDLAGAAGINRWLAQKVTL